MESRCSRSSLFVDVHDPVYNGDFPVLNLEDHHLACPQRLVAVVEEQDVSALEGRLHRTTVKKRSIGAGEGGDSSHIVLLSLP